MKRAALYVDGYNLYHGLDDFIATSPHPRPHYLKWVSLWALGEEITRIDNKISKSSGTLSSVDYFSAWARHLDRPRASGEPTAFGKQQIYVRALEATKVNLHMAAFTSKKMTCRGQRPNNQICGHTWYRHEEKQSDVGVAVRILEDAYEDKFDTFYMLSGDTDLLPTLRCFNAKFAPKGKRLVCVAPPSRATPTEMQGLVSGAITLRPVNIKSCLLPSSLLALDGTKIRRPKDYAPPPAAPPAQSTATPPHGSTPKQGAPP